MTDEWKTQTWNDTMRVLHDKGYQEAEWYLGKITADLCNQAYNATGDEKAELDHLFHISQELYIQLRELKKE
jgi:hypothetical protein